MGLYLRKASRLIHFETCYKLLPNAQKFRLKIVPYRMTLTISFVTKLIDYEFITNKTFASPI